MKPADQKPDAGAPPPPPPKKSKFGPNPYVGAEPLSKKNKIFGRDTEIRDLFFLLTKERIVLMYAPSGAGKSSLLVGEGGLVDQMDERFDVWPVTRVNTHSVHPCRNPYVLSALLGFERAAPPEHMRSEDQLAGMTLLDGVMTRWRHPDEPPIRLLVFDQFEEIVRLNPTDWNGQQEFFRQLGDLLSEPSIWALLVMREDYLASIDPFCRQLPTHLRNRFRLDLLNREMAMEAIAETAKTAGRYWDEPAVKRLVDDLALVKIQPLHGPPRVVPGQYVEPLQLQVVCNDLWDKLAPDDESFGMDDLDKIGDVDLALANNYARCVHEISNGNLGVERAIRTWFSKELILPGFVRGQVLRGPEDSGGLNNSLVDALVDKHLVRAEKRSGATWYELSHDRLMPALERCNREWFSEKLQPLERWAEIWVTQARNPDLLQTGSVLRGLREWAGQNPDRVHDNERAFLSMSERENRKGWRRIGLWAIVTFAAMGAAFFALVAVIVRVSENSTAAAGSAAALHGSRANDLAGRKEWAEAWLYSLAAFNEGSQATGVHPDIFGRFLQFEIYPNLNWRDRAKVALGTVRRSGPMDRILFVSTKSDSENYSAAVLQRFTKTGFEVYQLPRDSRGSTAENPIVSYNVGGEGPLGENFTGGIYCLEVSDKIYFAGGNQLVEHSALGRRLATGDSPVIALRRTKRGIGVLTEDGKLRFVKVSTMAWEPGEWHVPSEGLAGFDVVEDDLAVAYEDVGDTSGRIAVWGLAKNTALRFEDAVVSSASLGNRVVSIVGQNPRIVAYGTQSGEVGLIHFPPQGEASLLAKATLHNGAVIQLAGAGFSESDDDLVSVSEDGEVRHIRMRINPFSEDKDYLLWNLAMDPKATATQEFFKQMQTRSIEKLHYQWESPRFLSPDRAKLMAAKSEWFGYESSFQYKRYRPGELIRAQNGEWQWNSPLGGVKLREKNKDQSAVVLDGSGLEIRVPLRAGEWVTVNGIGFTRISGITPDRVDFDAGYILDIGAGRWQTGSGGELRSSILTRRGAMPNGEDIFAAGENGASFLVPRGEGPLRFRTSPVAEPVNIGNTLVETLNYLPDQLETVAAPHRIQYKSVTVNGGSNVLRVKPGQAVSVRARWNVTLGADSAKVENFFLGMDTPEGGVSRCVAIVGGERPASQRKSGYVQLEFRAPTKRGWYFLTHAAHTGAKCVAEPGMHASGPIYAIAAIFVESRSDDDN